MQSGKIRIIGEAWRGRKLAVAKQPGLRPTPDRLRETLFNWLMPVTAGSDCLDLFAGTGALGLEAASRGAQQVTLVEKQRIVAQQLRQHVQLLNAEQVQIHHNDALKFLHNTQQQFDLVFLDPPFHQNLLQPCCDLLLQNGCLKPNAYLYLEAESSWQQLALTGLEGLELLKQQQAGQSHSMLLRYSRT